MGPRRRGRHVRKRVAEALRECAGCELAAVSRARAALAVTHAAADREDTFDLFRDAGSIRVPWLNSGHVVVRVGEAERAESNPPAANLHLALVEDFVELVRIGRPPAVDGHTGRAVAAIQEAIYADPPSVR